MRDLLHRKHCLLALLCMSLGACSDTGGSDGDGSGEGSSGFVEEDGGSDGSGSGSGGDATGSGEGSGIFDDTPVFLSVPPAAVEAGQRWSYEVRYAPADGVALSLVAGPAGATLEGNTLVWEVPDDGTATSSFTLALSREAEPSVEQAFELRIGHAPAFGSAPATRANRGEDYLFVPAVSDADGDAVSLTLLEAPAWLALGADNRLTGQPDSSGAFDVTLIATDAIGLSARLDWSISVVEQLDGLTAQVGYLTTAGGTLDLFAASMPEGAEVLWGDTAAARVERLSTGTQLRATFPQLPVGVQPVVVTVSGSTVGQLREPLLVVPAATGSIRNGAYRFQLFTPVRAAAPPRIVLPDASGLGLATAPVSASYAGDVLSLVAQRPDGALPGGAATLAFDGFQSLPIAIAGAGTPAVTQFVPAEAAAGATLIATVAGLDEGATVTAQWSLSGTAAEATAVVTAGSASFEVPAGAEGVVALQAGGQALRSYATSATAASAVATVPTLAWANREILTAGLEQHLLVRGHGFANPALQLELEGGSARVVWSDGNEAVLALTTTGRASALLTGGTGGLRQPLWRFSVEAERFSAGEQLENSGVAPGDQRTAAEAPVGTGVVVPNGGLRAALAPDGIWLSAEVPQSGLGLALTSDWTRLGEPIPADKRAIRDAAGGPDGLTLLTVQGDLIALDATGSRARLTSPWTGIAPQEAALLSQSRLTGASHLVAVDNGLLALLPEEGRLLGIAPRDESYLLGVTLDAQSVAPLVALDRPMVGAGFLAANSGCAVFGDAERIVAVDAAGRRRLDLTLSGEAASSSGTVATALGGGLVEAAMTPDSLYLIDLTGQLLAVSMSAGCVTAESTLTLVAGGLTGRRQLRADNNAVLLSGNDELRDGATGALLAATAPVVARFSGRVEDALVSAEGLTVTDGSSVATVRGLPAIWSSRCPSEGCAIGGAALLTQGTEGLSLLDLGDTALVAATVAGALRTGFDLGPLSASALPFDTRVVGEAGTTGAMLTSPAGGLWFAALSPGGLPTLIAPPDQFPALTLVGGLGSAAPAGASVAQAALSPRAAAYDASLRLWVVDGDGSLYVTGGDGALVAIQTLTQSHAGCLDRLPAAGDLALDSDGRLLLASATGQIFRREDDGAFCVTGLGGLGGDPSARLYGPSVRLRGGEAGLAIVRSATGTAVGLRPSY